MIIPSFEHNCGTINPERITNLLVDQGTFQIRSIVVTCGGCGKQKIITGLLDKDGKEDGKEVISCQKG